MNLNDIHGFDAMLAQISTEFPSLKLHVRRTESGTLVTAASGNVMTVASATEVARVGAAARKAVVDLHARLVVNDRRLTGLAQEAERIKQQVASLPEKRLELTAARERAVALENTIAVLGEDLHSLDAAAFAARIALIKTKRTELTELQARISQLVAEVQNLEGLNNPQAQVDCDDDDDSDDDWDDDDDYLY